MEDRSRQHGTGGLQSPHPKGGAWRAHRTTKGIGVYPRLLLLHNCSAKHLERTFGSSLQDKLYNTVQSEAYVIRLRRRPACGDGAAVHCGLTTAQGCLCTSGQSGRVGTVRV